MGIFKLVRNCLVAKVSPYFFINDIKCLLADSSYTVYIVICDYIGIIPLSFDDLRASYEEIILFACEYRDGRDEMYRRVSRKSVQISM
jgi:hypothetical protein